MGPAVDQAKAQVLQQAAAAVGPRRAAFAAAVLAAAGYAYYANSQERKRKHKKHKRGWAGLGFMNCFIEHVQDYIYLVGISIVFMLQRMKVRGCCTHIPDLLILILVRARCVCRSHGPHPSGQKKVGKKGKPQGHSLRRLLEFLIPLVGRKIVMLFALSIVRTALSNRLAKIQVLLEICNVLGMKGQAMLAICADQSRHFLTWPWSVYGITS